MWARYSARTCSEGGGSCGWSVREAWHPRIRALTSRSISRYALPPVACAEAWVGEAASVGWPRAGGRLSTPPLGVEGSDEIQPPPPADTRASSAAASAYAPAPTPTAAGERAGGRSGVGGASP